MSSSRRLGQRHPILRGLNGPKRQWFLASFLAAITLGSGVLNLLSVMGGPSQSRWLLEIFPIEFIRLSRTLTLLIGFALIVSSLNIYKRKRRAWEIVLVLSSAATVLHLTRGLEYEEAALSFVVALLLVLARDLFTVKSSTPDLKSGVLRLGVAAAVAVGYGIAGFWFLHERHFGINFHIGDAARTTMRLLLLADDPRLTPHTGYAHWFLDSLYLISITAILYAGLALFRPVVYRFRIAPRERALAQALVQQFGRTSMDFFKLWPDKSYFFSPSHRCFIAYRVAGNVALALGDPVGPEDELAPTIQGFLAMCRDNAWGVGFHQTLPDFLPTYHRLRLKKLKVGDNALVDLTSFSLEGKARKEFRSKVRQLEAAGFHTHLYPPPIPDYVLQQLEQVSDEWLRIPGRRERGFTLGQFNAEYLRSSPVLAVLDPQDHVVAFVNLISIADHKEISVDLMRRRTQAPNGIMDYLFVKVFLYAKEQGYEHFDMGMAPMAGFQEREEATVEERAIHSFFQQLNFLFSFRGLRHYKAKFATSWEPRYLIYRNIADLPRLALALRRVSEEATRNGNAEEAA